MPCKSDYLEQTAEEKNNQLAAELLIYVLRFQDKKVPAWLRTEAKTYYAQDPRSVPLLCAAVKEMSDEELHEIVYDGTNPTARKLADWWDRHLQMDKEKNRRARQERQNEALRASALAKLTPKERRALGVK